MAARAPRHGARDEARHAELGFRVLAYRLAEGGRDVREALAAAILSREAAPPEPEAERDVDRAALRENGRLSPREAESAWSEAWALAKSQGERMLAAR